MSERPGRTDTPIEAKAPQVTGSASAYHADFLRFRAALEGMQAAGGGMASACSAADVIVRAATDPNPRLRYTSGADAELMIAVRASSASFEDYEHTMRTALDWPVLAPVDVTGG